MPPVNVHPPDPEHPKGMAWVLGVGMVDPRPGANPNQVMAIVQSWEPTSELWWKLGLRWHPELATKWAIGGGQFAVADIVDEKPEDFGKSNDLKAKAEEVLGYIAEEHPEYAELLKKIKAAGSDEERAKISKQFESEIKKLILLTEYIKSKE